MRAIVTVGVNPIRAFQPYLERFKKTMRDPGGYDGYMSTWETKFPDNSPLHKDVQYAFKIFAVEDALKAGATTVLWLDCSCNATAPIEPVFDKIEKDGHYLLRCEDRLGNWSSDHCLKTFGITRDEAMEIYLLSGTCIGLDFTNPRSRKFFELWKSYAKPEHFNGTHKSSLKSTDPVPETEGAAMSDDPRCQGHRCDEPYTTMIARELGMNISIAASDYFYGGFGDDGKGLCRIRSGYDIAP